MEKSKGWGMKSKKLLGMETEEQTKLLKGMVEEGMSLEEIFAVVALMGELDEEQKSCQN